LKLGLKEHDGATEGCFTHLAGVGHTQVSHAGVLSLQKALPHVQFIR
jgi:hypothetical protein